MVRISLAAELLYCQSVEWLLFENDDCKVVPHIGGERNGDAGIW